MPSASASGHGGRWQPRISTEACEPNPARRAQRLPRREKDEHGDRHAPKACTERQCDTAALPQLSHVELASCLETDNEGEHAHQPTVHPVAKAVSHLRTANTDRNGHLPSCPRMVLALAAMSRAMRPCRGRRAQTRVSVSAAPRIER
jgi:hypothetical protein